MVSSMSDGQLLADLEMLCRREREITLQVLHHLNEVEKRKLHLKLGFSTMFDYCVKQLNYSESAACRRIAVARCIIKFPKLVALLEANALNLSAVAKISSILNEQNFQDIVSKARNAPGREVDELVANYRPPIQLRDRVQPVRVVVPQALGENHLRSGGITLTTSRIDSNGVAPVPATPPAPQTEAMLVFKFLANPVFKKKYDEACALLSNRLCDLSMEAVFTAVLDEFIERHSPRAKQERREKKRIAIKSRSSNARAIASATRDSVTLRDGSQCAYVSSTGTRCSETRNLQIDHVRPVARDGTNEAGNLRLLCTRHNQLEADRIFGRAFMDRYRNMPS